MSAERYALQSYAIPLFLALLVHAAVVATLWVNWIPDIDTSRVIKPHIVNAVLLVMEPRPKAAPKAQPPAPAVRNEPKPEPKLVQPVPKVEPKPQPKIDLAKQKAEEQARRDRELNRLSESAFTDALAQEAETLAANEDEQVAMSFAQGVYQLIVANWSRPPSARNGMEARLLVELVPTGDVVAVTLTQSSGSEAFDRSAEQAVRKAAKFDVPKDPDIFEEYFRKFPVLFKPEDLLR